MSKVPLYQGKPHSSSCISRDFMPAAVQGYLTHKKQHRPWDNRRVLGIVLL
jgi:hypothetical protein